MNKYHFNRAFIYTSSVVNQSKCYFTVVRYYFWHSTAQTSVQTIKKFSSSNRELTHWHYCGRPNNCPQIKLSRAYFSVESHQRLMKKFFFLKFLTRQGNIRNLPLSYREISITDPPKNYLATLIKKDQVVKCIQSIDARSKQAHLLPLGMHFSGIIQSVKCRDVVEDPPSFSPCHDDLKQRIRNAISPSSFRAKLPVKLHR